MAYSITYQCSECREVVDTWDDGNPYYIDRGRMALKGLPRSRCKVYVYHPERPPGPLDGNDVPHLCLACGHVFNVDSALSRTTCTKCRSSDIIDCCCLDGRTCPCCKKGSFTVSGHMIS